MTQNAAKMQHVLSQLAILLGLTGRVH
uniref:Uncharacterized protein n=1 Tax=Arundo donax TaxID=35708 RepID=A0A0A9A4R0_ARUDO